jgi:hypothetical protein
MTTLAYKLMRNGLFSFKYRMFKILNKHHKNLLSKSKSVVRRTARNFLKTSLRYTTQQEMNVEEKGALTTIILHTLQALYLSTQKMKKFTSDKIHLFALKYFQPRNTYSLAPRRDCLRIKPRISE